MLSCTSPATLFVDLKDHRNSTIDAYVCVRERETDRDRRRDGESERREDREIMRERVGREGGRVRQREGNVSVRTLREHDLSIRTRSGLHGGGREGWQEGVRNGRKGGREGGGGEGGGRGEGGGMGFWMLQKQKEREGVALKGRRRGV